MPERPVAEEGSQPERSRDRRDEQPENMLERFSTQATAQPERSRDRRDEQPENMPERSVASEVSTSDRLISNRAERLGKTRKIHLADAALQPERSRD